MFIKLRGGGSQRSCRSCREHQDIIENIHPLFESDRYAMCYIAFLDSFQCVMTFRDYVRVHAMRASVFPVLRTNWK